MAQYWVTTNPETGQTWTHLSRLADENNNVTHYMCCICMEYIDIACLWTDEDGQRWDMCPDCGRGENRVQQRIDQLLCPSFGCVNELTVLDDGGHVWCSICGWAGQINGR